MQIALPWACYARVVLDPGPLFPETVRPLRRVEYERIVDLGLFEDERVELLRGALVAMSPQKGPHANGAARLGEALALALRGRAHVRQHSPLALSDDSEPEPDIAVVAPGDYAKAHPQTALLVAEVADSSLRKDRHVKADLYAEANIPEYWILNVVDGVLEVYRSPTADHYASVSSHDRSSTVTPLAFPDVVVAVADLLR
jgi:Uma2 family endonuclease